jgi:hypothetical protein
LSTLLLRWPRTFRRSQCAYFTFGFVFSSHHRSLRYPHAAHRAFSCSPQRPRKPEDVIGHIFFDRFCFIYLLLDDLLFIRVGTSTI